MEKGILGRSQTKDSVVQASSRPTMWWIVFDSSRIIGGQIGWSIQSGCSSILAVTDHERGPWCAICGPHGYAQDLGIGGLAFPLARTQRQCIAVCEDLPHLSSGEIRQSGKNQFIATLGDSLKEMGAYNHGPGHRPTRVQWLYGYCGLHGQTNKNGASRPLYKGGDSRGICQTLCGSRLLITRSPGGDNFWSGSPFHRQVLEITIRLARYGSPFQHGVSSANWWTKQADDPDHGEFSETICQKTTCWLESTSGAGRVCGEQRHQCGSRLNSVFLNSGDHPIVLLILLHGRDALSHIEAMQAMVD